MPQSLSFPPCISHSFTHSQHKRQRDMSAVPPRIHSSTGYEGSNKLAQRRKRRERQRGGKGINPAKQNSKCKVFKKTSSDRIGLLGRDESLEKSGFTHNASDHLGVGPQRAAGNSIADVKLLFNHFPRLLSRLKTYGVASISASDCVALNAPCHSALSALCATQPQYISNNLDSDRMSEAPFEATEPPPTTQLTFYYSVCQTVRV